MKKITKKNALEACTREAKRGCYKKALDIVRRFKLTGVTVTRRTLKEEFGATEKQIKKLNFIEVDNPYYKCSGPMRLYLIVEAENKLNPIETNDLC